MAKKRKTRKEKIITSLKRRLQNQEIQKEVVVTSSQKKEKPKKIIKNNALKPLFLTNANNIKDIKSDLTRSIILSLLAIMAEVLLYFSQ